MAKSKYDIMKDTFCIYCQEEHETPQKLQEHVTQVHPGTYAANAILDRKRKGD